MSALGLAACDQGLQLPFGQTNADATPVVSRAAAAEPTGAEVEAPEVFSIETTGVWDGRPSLGGVWVAHPDVTEPERVLITNLANGETVTGALFRRERDNPGPSIMISSDAASALNVIAGEPTELTVVALRRQELPAEINIPVPPPEEAAEVVDESEETALPAEFAATALDPVTVAEAALEEVEVETAPAAETVNIATAAAAAIATSAAPAPAPVATLNAADIAASTAATPLPVALTAASTEPAPEVTPLPAPAPEVTEIAAVEPEPAPAPAPAETLTRPFIQVGIFSAEANANTLADQLRGGGMVPTVLDQSNADRSLWRVIVGPARNTAERAALLESIQGLGYEDAYFVTN